MANGDSGEQQAADFVPASPFTRWLLGLYLLGLFVLLFLAFISVWYTCDAVVTAGGPDKSCTLYLIDLPLPLSGTVALALLMALAGGLGSFVHAATSFASYAGNRRLDGKWGWWFVVRTPIAMVLALLFYFFLRAGFLGTASEPNPYGFIATGALVGMFSKQAADKLKEVFDTLFRSRGDEQRSGKLTAATPAITGASPKQIKVGEASPKVELAGSGFTAASALEVDGQRRAGKLDFVSAEKLVATLEAADVASARELKLAVVNPDPGGGRSATVTISVVP